MKKTNEEKLLLTVKEVCELTGLSEKTVRNFIYEKELIVKVGRRVMVNKKKLKEWIEKATG